MHRFRNILCLVNPDEKASAVVKRAAELATVQGTSLTLVHMQDTAAQGKNRELRICHENGVTENLLSHALYGDPAQAIVTEVLRGKHDLLIKPVDTAENGVDRLHAVDKFLLRQCPCPIWIFKPIKHDHQERILAALDSDMGGANAKLNDLVLDFSTSLGDREGTELHVVSSWGVNGEDTMRSRVGRLTIRRLVASIRRANMQWLRRLTRPYIRQGAKIKIHLTKGRRKDAILAEARKCRPDVIVMGNTGRVGISAYLFGTAAEQVLTQTDCSVLAVKPKYLVNVLEA